MFDVHTVTATVDGHRVPLRLLDGAVVVCDRNAAPQPLSFKHAINLGCMAMEQDIRGVQITEAA